jgi:hypothetical protein
MELQAAVAQLVEAPHSKCGARKRMWVRVPPAALDAPTRGTRTGSGARTRRPEPRFRKNVWALQVFQDDRYPGIIAEICSAFAAVMPANRVCIAENYGGANCTRISSYSKAWPCLFPQAGPGMKHLRKIELSAWQ